MNTPTSNQPDHLKEEGLRLFQRGAYAEAVTLFETAAAAYAAQEDELGRAEMLNNLGVVHRVRRHYAAAAEALQQAAVLFARGGDEKRQGQALANLGDLHAAQKAYTPAARAYSDAIEHLAASGDRHLQSSVLRALSLMRLRQGQWLDAMIQMESSLTVRPRLGPGQWLFRGLLRFALRLFTIQ